MSTQTPAPRSYALLSIPQSPAEGEPMTDMYLYEMMRVFLEGTSATLVSIATQLDSDCWPLRMADALSILAQQQTAAHALLELWWQDTHGGKGAGEETAEA